MLYECTECKHQISSDAWRCPNCGSKDAGSRAEKAYLEHQLFLEELEKDRTDPGWRGRPCELNAEALSAIAKEKRKVAWARFWRSIFR